ncbi:hypothetical protein DEM91_03730 [Prevotella sp. TCVGH]|nr:hypothetical protein [Prevotella sp. TCVGH]
MVVQHKQSFLKQRAVYFFKEISDIILIFQKIFLSLLIYHERSARRIKYVYLSWYVGASLAWIELRGTIFQK